MIDATLAERRSNNKMARLETMAGAWLVNLLLSAVVGFFATGLVGLTLSLIVNLLFWSRSCDSLGAYAVGLRYEQATKRAAGIKLMASSGIIQYVIYFLSGGVGVIVDTFMVLGSTRRQGMAGMIFGIYPIENSSSIPSFLGVLRPNSDDPDDSE